MMVTEAEVRQASQSRVAALELRLAEHRIRALESTLKMWDRFVSFEDDELIDGTGREVWSRIGLADPGSLSAAYTSEAGLDHVRGYGRWLATHNEFAINGYENRVNYVVGQGHQYRIEMQAGEESDGQLIDETRRWLERWMAVNKWPRRQQEIRRRIDRDGEVFLRFFPLDGMLYVRFIEPERIRTPAEKSGNPRVRYGIEFDPDDAEKPLQYFVNGQEVNAAEVQHRKEESVDLAAPRGLPLFYPVRGNLRRAEKLLENLSHLAGSRAAMAWIEKHLHATQSQVQAYLDGATDVSVVQAQGETTNYQRLRPGTVKHVAPNTEFEFPPTPEISGFVQALQAELRAVASRLVMPEFMLTSDASNANYSSTMVAEGPAVKMFERLQAATISDDEEVLALAMRHAAAAGHLPEEAIALVVIVAEPPIVQTRDRLKDVQADHILSASRVLSKTTFAARHGLDYDAERESMEEEAETETGWSLPPFTPRTMTGDADAERT